MIKLAYKSLSGGYFIIDYKYTIIPPYEKDDIINEWQNQLVQFETKYKNELDHLAELLITGRIEESKKFYDDFLVSIKPPLPGIHKEEKIELNVSHESEYLNIQPISEIEYNLILKQSSCQHEERLMWGMLNSNLSLLNAKINSVEDVRDSPKN